MKENKAVRPSVVLLALCILGPTGVGTRHAAADDLPPHPPANVVATYDANDGTVGIEWDRSVGARRYEVGEGETVVYPGGWEPRATLVATSGDHAYRVRACNDQCGDWSAPATVTVGAYAPPLGIRYGGGTSSILLHTNVKHSGTTWTLEYGEIGLSRGRYRAAADDERTLGGSTYAALYTAYESYGPAAATSLDGRFFVVSGVESARSRFSLAFDTRADHAASLSAGLFIATWEAAAGWQVRNNLGAAEAFTPLPTDVVVAVGYRAASSPGIGSLKALVPDDPLPGGLRYGEGVMDFALHSNAGDIHPDGDIRVSDGVLRPPDGTERRLATDQLAVMLTPFEPTSRDRGNDSIGWFFVVSGAESAVDRFALTFRTQAQFRIMYDAGFFVASWSEADGWEARNNVGDREAFTPLATDVAIAIGHRASTASPGLDSLRTMTPRAAISTRGRALAVDSRADRLYRMEYGRNLVTDVVDLGSTAPSLSPSGIARIGDGVALVVDYDDHLYRVEHDDDSVLAVTDLGNVAAVLGEEEDVHLESVAHAGPGVALVGDDLHDRLLRVTYADTGVTAVTGLGELVRRPWGMAGVQAGTALVVDDFGDRLNRVEYGATSATVARVGRMSGIGTPSGLARVAPGTALVVNYGDPDVLFGVEHRESSVDRVFDLGEIRPLNGVNGLTHLPPRSSNAAPVAVDDTAATTKGATVSIDVLANDTDDDGDVLTVEAVIDPANGTAVISSDGAVAYTPDAEFVGEDTFDYTVTDGTATASATVAVTVGETPLAVYDPDANTIVVERSVERIGPGEYEVEERFRAFGGQWSTTTHVLAEPRFLRMNPTPGEYSYRIRACPKGNCDEDDWSTWSTVTVSVPPMYTDEPEIDPDTVPGSLPYDVGVTKGGQAYVNVPVQPVPGVNGLAPRLSIDYSGGRERQRISDRLPGDMLGYGWRIGGLSTIRRCTKNRRGTDTIDFSDRDGLCLDGEPLVRVAPSAPAFAAGTEYRTYRESYARILVRRDDEGGQPWFEVFRPDGGVAEYGRTDDSRLALGSGNNRTAAFLWSVNRERDAYGNEMVHAYHEDEESGVRHPLRIEYGDDGDAEIRFRYAARSDHVSTPYGGRTRAEKLLLHTIEVRLEGRPVREYRLSSETTAEGWRRLDRLQLCGYDERGTNATCLAPMDFDWMTPAADGAGYTTLVERFTDPLGRATAFEHAPVTDEGVRFAERPFGTPAAPGAATEDDAAKPLVTAMARDDGVGGTHRTEYAYHGKGFVSTLGWGFLGFYSTRVTDTSNGVVTYFQYRLDLPHYARVSAVHQYDRIYDPDDPAVETLSRTLTRHDAKQIGRGSVRRFVPFVQRQTEVLYEGGTELGARQTIWTLKLDAAGLPTRSVGVTHRGSGSLSARLQPPRVWGGVPLYNFDSGGKPTTTSTLDLQNRAGSSGNTQWLVGFTCRSVLEEKRPGVPVRRRWTSFSPAPDSLAIETATLFGRTSSADCPMDPGYAADAGLELTQTYGYDASGNLVSAAAESTTGHVSSRTSRAGSFASGRYPQRLTNAAGHAETLAYDLRFGLPKSRTDPNGQSTSREYDPFGREVRRTTRDGVAATTRHLWCGTDVACARVGRVAPAMAVETDSPATPRTTTYLDRLGRPVRTETESFDGLAVDRVDTAYDDRGRVSRVSAPYRYAQASDLRNVRETEYDYDLRDRPDKINRADGGEVTITREACGDEVQVAAEETVYDADGAAVATRSRVSRHGLDAELVRLTEGGGEPAAGCGAQNGLSDAVTTTYRHNSSGQVREVAVAGHKVASYEHDAAGHLVASERPDAGRTAFERTALGELHARTDAEARSVTYRYDVLGRPTKASDSSGTSYWTYDEAANGIGLPARRCRMPGTGTDGCGRGALFDEAYAYGADARLSATTTTVATAGTTRTFAASRGYDAFGRPATATYPSGLAVRYRYNATGRLEALLDDRDSAELLVHRDRDAWGNATGMRHGNGALVSRTFEPGSGRQTRGDVRLSGKLRHDALYSWRTDGLLAERSVRGVLDDGVSSGLREEAFAHDGLGRLTEAAASTGGVGRTLAYGYDGLGNLLSRTSTVAADVDVVEYDYGAGRNAVRHARIGDVRHQFAYDRSGRMTRDRQCRELSGRCTPRRRGAAVDDRHVEWDGRGLARRVLLGGGPSDPTPTARETFRHGPGGGLYERVSEWREDDVARSARTLQVGAYERTYPADPAVEHVERTRLPGGVVHVRTTPADGAATEAFEYRHVDHLGSTAAVSGAGAAPLAVLGHDPFGGRRRADWTRELTADESAALSGRRTARGFGGHEHLDRTGLVHMGGRLHDPRLGRFLSPDPYVADPASSQDWNAYSYVANSPLSHADPTGLFRAGPGCNVHGVMCLEADGGGFSPDAQAFEHAATVSVVVPFVETTWHWGYGGWGYGGRDRPGVLGGHGFGVPRHTFGLLVSSLPHVFAGTLQVDGESPADEPMAVGAQAPGAASGVGVTVDTSVEGDAHRYVIRARICKRSAVCNEAWADRVFGHVNRNDVPYSRDDLGDGQKNLLFGTQPIDHEEDPSLRRSINRTLEGHILHRGQVVHEVDFGQNGYLDYVIVGTGSDGSPRFANAVGVFTFRPGAREVLRRFGHPPRERMRTPNVP